MALTPLKPPGNSTVQQTSSQSSAPSGNFAKALLEAGGHAAQATVDAGVGMVGDALQSLFGATTGAAQANPNETNTQNAQTSQNEVFNSQEKEWKRREMRTLRHREVQETQVFNRRSVEEEQKINLILEQLSALAKDLDDADRTAREAQIAVMQGAVATGDYYVTFFEKLLKTIMLLRQKVQESSSWLAQFNNRKQAQQGYWGNFYSQGTQWSMSNERALATSVG